MPTCPVTLSADLIRCQTVTPNEGGALTLLDNLLSKAGFECVRVDRNGTPNLFARLGPKNPRRSFGFNGHTDVVPVGDAAAWSVDPFGGEIRDGILWGRGATDMKTGVAAFAAAAIDFRDQLPSEDAICLAITGDEEGDATDGTVALLDYMHQTGERMDHCLVGEPTCPDQIGDMIKIGRRGSITAWITVAGQQGHAAYPHRALNPLPAIADLVRRLSVHELDTGSAHFDASTLAVVTIDTGNSATNVIPSQSTAALNIRFNDLHSGASIAAWLEQECARTKDEHGVEVSLRTRCSGESFLTAPGDFSDLVSAAIQAETGLSPALSTSGGTSDARFIKDHCPVLEFGLVGKTMHQVDEHVPVEQIHQLKAIYGRVLEGYFNDQD